MGSNQGMKPLIEAAAECGLSYNTVLRLVMTKAVRGQRAGRSWFCCSEDLLRWQREQTPQPVPAA